MNDAIDLPLSLVDLRPRTFALIDANWLSVREFFFSLWGGDEGGGWFSWTELPARLNVNSVGTYQGHVQLGLLRPAVERSRGSTLWTTEADSANPFLYKLAYRVRCRVIATTFCFDWASNNALAELMVYDGRTTYCERLVRVMRVESGKLEYFESGLATEVEPKSGFRHGLLKKRLSEDVLFGIWRGMGVDIGGEMLREPEREGLVYVQAKKGPLSPGEAFGVIA